MRLIDYNAAIDRYHKEYKTQDICDGAQDRDFLMRCFDEAETIDAAPVVHGRWEEIRDPYGALEGWIHTECGREVKCAENYCPTCGAKMDLPEDSD